MIMGAAQRVLPTAVRIPNFQIFGDGPDGIVTHWNSPQTAYLQQNINSWKWKDGEGHEGLFNLLF